VIRYRLGEAAANRRAFAAAAVGAATSLAPALFGVVLLGKVGWRPTAVFWVVAVGLAALVALRLAVGYQAARRRLVAMVVTLGEGEILLETARETTSIDRARVASIVEVEGDLGGLRVESCADPTTGVVSVVHVPRGGESFGEVRAQLEKWQTPARRGRRGLWARLALGVAVVTGIFFAPFLFDDFVGRSKLVAAFLVVGMWLSMRWVLRKG
jgi:hypothetical protein